MGYKDETFLDKIWGIRYSLIWIVWAILGWVVGTATAKHFDDWSLAPALPILGIMVLGMLVQKYKLLGED